MFRFPVIFEIFREKNFFSTFPGFFVVGFSLLGFPVFSEFPEKKSNIFSTFPEKVEKNFELFLLEK